MTTSFVRALLPTPAPAAALHLFDGPYAVVGGRRTELPEGSKRLVAYIALNGGRVERRTAAGTLWPDGNDIRAAGNLRSALWRLRGAGVDVVEADKCALRLTPSTMVDLDVVADWAARLIDGTASSGDLETSAWRSPAPDLLPGWYDDWVVFERERLRHRLLHGLEALSRLLVRAGRCAEGVEAALAVTGADPLRESAQRVLIEAHLAEGNLVEARRAYVAYRDTVSRELHVQPGPDLARLLAPRPPARIPVVERPRMAARTAAR